MSPFLGRFHSNMIVFASTTIVRRFTTPHIPISMQSYSTAKRPLSPSFGLALLCSDGPTSSLGVPISIAHDCRHMWHFSDHICMFLDIPFFFLLFLTLYSLFYISFWCWIALLDRTELSQYKNSMYLA